MMYTNKPMLPPPFSIPSSSADTHAEPDSDKLGTFFRKLAFSVAYLLTTYTRRGILFGLTHRGRRP